MLLNLVLSYTSAVDNNVWESHSWKIVFWLSWKCFGEYTHEIYQDLPYRSKTIQTNLIVTNHRQPETWEQILLDRYSSFTQALSCLWVICWRPHNMACGWDCGKVYFARKGANSNIHYSAGCNLYILHVIMSDATCRIPVVALRRAGLPFCWHWNSHVSVSEGSPVPGKESYMKERKWEQTSKCQIIKSNKWTLHATLSGKSVLSARSCTSSPSMTTPFTRSKNSNTSASKWKASL